MCWIFYETKADGSKFGKSEAGNIWLDPEKTTPYQFYQFWINADDRDSATFMRYFTLKSKEEVEALEKEYADNPRGLKEILAEELTRRVHSDEDYEAVLKVSELLFRKVDLETIKNLDTKTIAAIAREIPVYKIPKNVIADQLGIVDLLTEQTDILSSKSDAKRTIKNNAISINKVKVTKDDLTVSTADLLHDRYMFLDNGKKNKMIIEAI